MHDLAIRDLLIVDGTGRAPFGGDIAVDSGRLVQVGGRAGPARREMRAQGAIATPGFVDVHTHYDGQVRWDPYCSPSSWHGVTTVVMGNCGIGFAPVRPEQREWLMELMEDIEDIPSSVLRSGLNWQWETFPQYMDALAATPRAIDIGAQIPHAAVRAYVMGERGARNEPATPEDLSAMAEIVKEGMRAGALGLTGTRTTSHRTKQGGHVPGYGLDPSEFISLGRAAGQSGCKGALGVNVDFENPAEEIAWLRRLQRESGMPVWCLLLQKYDRPMLWLEVLERMEAATREGEPLLAQVAGRPVGILLGLTSSRHPFFLHQSYKEIAALPLAERVRRLREPAFHARLLKEKVEPELQILRSVTSRFDRMFPLGDPPDYEPSPEKSIAHIAAREGKMPTETVLDLMLQDEGRELIFLAAANYADGDHAATLTMLRHPNCILGLSDGGAHISRICDSSTPTYMLTHWARDRNRGPKMPLEEVVHLQTKRTAGLYGLNDRGALLPGLRADINLIDLTSLYLHRPEMTTDLPGHGSRLVQRVNGYVATIVAGEFTMEKDEATGAMPGKLIRGGGK